MDTRTADVQARAASLVTGAADQPLWQSAGVCRQRYHLNVTSLNALLGACARGFCTVSCDCPMYRAFSPDRYTAYTCSSSDTRTENDKVPYVIDGATDASVYSAAIVRYSSAERCAWFQAMLPNPQPIRTLWLRASISSDARFSLTALFVNGSSFLIGSTPPVPVDGTEYDIPRSYSSAVIAGFRVEVRPPSGGNAYCYAGEGQCMDFHVTEISAMPRNASCADELTIDLGTVQQVMAATAQVYSDSVSRLALSTSVDGKYFREERHALSFDPNFWKIDSTVLLNTRSARFVRWAAYNTFKISVIELAVYGINGNGAVACPNNCSGSNGACINGSCNCHAGNLA